MYGSHRMREVIGFRQTLVFTVFEVSPCVSNLCVQSVHPFSASGGLYALIPIYSGVETDTEEAGVGAEVFHSLCSCSRSCCGQNSRELGNLQASLYRTTLWFEISGQVGGR